MHDYGPLLVSAGAGSGKTRVLTHRIAHLISERGVHPGKIFAVTFTNKAAQEMLNRVVGLVGPSAARMWIRTFHSACARILRFDAEKIDFPSDFSIYDETDSIRLISLVVADLGMDKKVRKPRAWYDRISSAKNAMVGPVEYAALAENYLERHTAKVYAEYQDRLRNAGAMDFDDLLLNTLRLFVERPDVLESYQDRFIHVLVDEYQDTNKPQNELVLRLGAKHGNVFVVGDSDQSIYSFRGAALSNIMEFDAAFGDASVILLEQNYRSTRNILSVANAVISGNVDRLPKKLWSDKPQGRRIVWYRAADGDDEAAWLIDEVRRLTRSGGYRLGDVAVMYRTNAQSRVPESAFLAGGLAYQVVGAAAFYERKEIRDALAFLKCVVNPADEMSLRRVINVPRRGVGERSIQRLSLWSQEHNLSFAEALENAKQADVSPAARRGISSFLDLLGEARERLDEGPAEVLEFLLTKSGYLGELTDDFEQDVLAAGRLENLKELFGAASEFSSVRDFLEQAALVSTSDLVTTPEEQDESEPKVQVLTVHASKGLEFPVVFLLGMEDGLFPFSRALDDPSGLEEERRLAYVGITRAKDRLYLSSAAERRIWNQTLFHPPSRFLEEIPDALLEEVLSPNLASYGGYGGGRGGRAESLAERRRRRRERFVADAAASAPTRGKGAPPGGLRATDLKIGSGVLHPQWGEGVVIDVHHEGEEATVAFSGVGEKRLLLAWARLSKID